MASVLPEKFNGARPPLRMGANPYSTALGYAAGQLGYAQVVADQGGITTLTALTGLAVNNLKIGASRRLKISFQGAHSRSVADGHSRFGIRVDSVVKQFVWIRNSTTGIESVYGSYVFTPSAGTHSFDIVLERFDGTGTVSLRAGGDTPAFIIIEDIGAA